MVRPRLEVAGMFRAHGAEYLSACGPISPARQRVLHEITACRTAELGGHVERCGDCGFERNAYNSCRNRHCPKCQARASAEWLEARARELLPVEYFHVVFTLPEELAAWALQNKKVLYGILFRSSAETLKQIAADPKHLGAEIGFVSVLHTWGQNLHHHPHVHCIVPGGGLSAGRTEWTGPEKTGTDLSGTGRAVKPHSGSPSGIVQLDPPQNDSERCTSIAHALCSSLWKESFSLA